MSAGGVARARGRAGAAGASCVSARSRAAGGVARSPGAAARRRRTSSSSSATAPCPAPKLHLLVSDTSVRCNHGDPLPLTSEQTIEARDITDDLLSVQRGEVAYPKPPPAQIFHFKITDEEGTLRFPDTAQRPAVLPRTARFIRRVAIDTCKLTR